MSDKEKEKIDLLIAKLDSFSDETRKELSTIKRGVYGDPENKVPGLLERQERDEERIEGIQKQILRIDKRQYKQGLYIGVGAFTLQVIYNFIKEKIF